MSQTAPGFDHLVVLMLENRSFDHLLGYLYEDDASSRFIPDGDRVFRGVAGRSDLGNYDDQEPPVFHPVTRAPYETLADMNCPFPDPGEELYPHMNHQIYGRDDVPGDPDTMPALPTVAPMSGFLRDYLRRCHQPWHVLPHQRAEGRARATQILRCFPPQATPVLSGLARAYAVSDAWFASVPSQTYTNRSFLHAADSGGFVHNANYAKWAENHATTIFERLEDRFGPRQGFRVYWDPLDKFPITRLIHRPLYDRRFDPAFCDMAAFERDCASGDLPAYAFIQPRVLMANNDMHPAFFPGQTATSSILGGEALIARVYDALRRGPRWARTLLVLLFDEHGGTYDHVPPPGATPPHAAPPYELEQGFGFDRFGVRVPAVFISPWIDPGTVLRAGGEVPFDHTSVIKTLCRRFGLASLTDRDRAAPDFLSVLTRTAPRLDAPTVIPRPHMELSEEEARRAPLTGLQAALLGLAARSHGLPPRAFASLGEAMDFFAMKV